MYRERGTRSLCNKQYHYCKLRITTLKNLFLLIFLIYIHPSKNTLFRWGKWNFCDKNLVKKKKKIEGKWTFPEKCERWKRIFQFISDFHFAIQVQIFSSVYNFRFFVTFFVLMKNQYLPEKIYFDFWHQIWIHVNTL